MVEMSNMQGANAGQMLHKMLPCETNIQGVILQQ